MPSMSGQHKFNRAYKACNKCRQRKSRCQITAEEYSSGLPCARCRREMKECTFPDERQVSTPKRRRSERRTNDGINSEEDSARPAKRVNDVDHRNVEDDRVRIGRRLSETQTELQYQPYFSTADPEPSIAPTLEEANPVPENPIPPIQGEDRRISTNIGDPMLRTVISNGNDALNLLFEAAQKDSTNEHGLSDFSQDNNGQVQHDSRTPQGSVLAAAASSTSPTHSTLYGAPNPCVMSTNLSKDLLETWRAYRFVTTGWLSPEEAVTYVDLFFLNMNNLSPILDDFYSHHENHYYLVVREPMLCCMILTISARYHVLPVSGGESRGFLIHQRLWEHCQHLLMRIMLGQEKGSKAKTRTLGSVEALMLLTEWQPRGLHVPPGSDGWDSDALFTLQTGRDENALDTASPWRSRWLQDVLEPARRFDRMSWMALGAAITLANELSVFDFEESSIKVPTGPHDYEARMKYRPVSLASLLFTQQEQLSSRLGRRPLMTQNASSAKRLASISKVSRDPNFGQWESFMLAWTELTKLTRSINDLLFPSALMTSHLLQTGRYVGLIEHFAELLSAWEVKHMSGSQTAPHFYDVLWVEYNHARVYANSLGLQAVVERSTTETASEPFDLTATDYTFVTAVVDGCMEILKTTSKLQQRGSLRFCSISIFLRFTSASVFLLKGLAIGVNVTKLREALGILTQAIASLKSCKPDDLHVGARYAALLEVHVARLQENFAPATKPPMLSSGTMSADGQQMQPGLQEMDWNPSNAQGMGSLQFDAGSLDHSWLTLPFDPSLVPFAADESMEFQGLGDDSLNFIWNLQP